MSSLRKLVTDPRCWLVLLAAIMVLVILDATRAPSEQITVKIYISGIRGYQIFCRPVVSQFIRCRYHPTCSQYCIAAARRHGIARGLLLGFTRVLSCRESVPAGTEDLVPD